MDTNNLTPPDDLADPSLQTATPSTSHPSTLDNNPPRNEREISGERPPVNGNSNEKAYLHPPPQLGVGLAANKNPFATVIPSPKGTAKPNPFQRIAEAKKQPQGPGSEVIGPNPFQQDRVGAPVQGVVRQPEENVEPIKFTERGANIKFESLGFVQEEMVIGETLVTSIKCTVMFVQYPAVYTPGQLVITNYRIVFKTADDQLFFRKYPLRKDYMSIPMGFIYKLERSLDKRDSMVSYLDVYSKDGRTMRFRFKDLNESSATLQYLQIYSFPEKKDYFFAFDHFKFAREFEEKYQGWKIYDIEKEFQRQGVDFVPLSQSGTSAIARFRIIENKNFKLSPTYPPLLLIPFKMSNHSIDIASRFRTKERFPVVTYYYAKKGTVLSRSSQSKPGLTQNRCIEDEMLLRYLGNPDYDQLRDPEPNNVNLYIFDARPYLNAVANRVNGKGYEDTRYYKNCEIEFMDIDNIHHVRDAHKKLISLCFSSEITNYKWYSQLESTSWLEIMSYIITASSKVAQCLHKGKNCLVHCSDGWDRTAQILSLAQIMLDPYFRTIEGFEVLIMKDWVNFGHQFCLRIGHGSKNEKDDQKAPVFLQFLDCVQQLCHQFPFAFEFKDTFLSDIAYHAYSCHYGTFLCNTYQEVMFYQIETKTVSIWSFLNSQKEKYLNPYFGTVQDHETLVLRPSSHLKHLRLWEEHFLFYSWLSKPNYSLSENMTFSRDFHGNMFQRERERSEAYKLQIQELKKKLENAGLDSTLSQKVLIHDSEGKIRETDLEEAANQEEVDAFNLEGDQVQSKIKEKEEEEVIESKERHGEIELGVEEQEEK